MNICENTNILSIFRIVNISITIIKIIVPIVLIVMLSVDFLRAVKDKDSDALIKARKRAVPRVIAAALVFCIPTMVMVLANIMDAYSDGYASCLVNANKTYITESYANKAKMYLKFASQSLKRSDYSRAISAINRIDDEEIRKELLKEAAKIDKAIKEKQNESINIPAGTSGYVANSLGIYYYKQCDKRWGNIKYDTGSTLCSSSCGYTSFAMIAAGLNNDSSINPYSVIKTFRKTNDGHIVYTGSGAARWGEIANNKRIAQFGLSCETIRKTEIMSYLRDGHPMIALVPGHYVVLSYSNNGKVVLMDPFTNWASKKKKSGEYNSISEIERAYGSIRKVVAYSKL